MVERLKAGIGLIPGLVKSPDWLNPRDWSDPRDWLGQSDRGENADPEQRADQHGIDDADRGRHRVVGRMGGRIGRERRGNAAALRPAGGAGGSKAKIGEIAHGLQRGSNSLNLS